jgi:hypothetical protein
VLHIVNLSGAKSERLWTSSWTYIVFQKRQSFPWHPSINPPLSKRSFPRHPFKFTTVKGIHLLDILLDQPLLLILQLHIIQYYDSTKRWLRKPLFFWYRKINVILITLRAWPITCRMVYHNSNETKLQHPIGFHNASEMTVFSRTSLDITVKW